MKKSRDSKLVFHTQVVLAVLVVTRQKKSVLDPRSESYNSYRIPRKIEMPKIKFMIKYAQKMRKHRLCGNGISNYRSQMTTGGATGDSLIWWCKQQDGI